MQLVNLMFSKNRQFQSTSKSFVGGEKEFAKSGNVKTGVPFAE